MKTVDLRVDIKAEFDWLYPPVDIHCEVTRQQSNMKLAALASRLEEKVKEMIWDEIKSVPDT